MGRTRRFGLCPRERSESALSSITVIPAGTLDETSWLKPTMEIYCNDAQSWVQLGGAMQRFPKNAAFPENAPVKG